MNSLGLILVEEPSIRLTEILSRNKLSKPIQIIESTEIIPKISKSLVSQAVQEKFKKGSSIKKTLNNIAGVYICINLINGKMYVGSASLNGMYRRFRGHLYLGANARGSKLVNRAVLKYGLINFAFVVIEKVSTERLRARDKEKILNLEPCGALGSLGPLARGAAGQKYLDLLNPSYNILNVAAATRCFKFKMK